MTGIVNSTGARSGVIGTTVGTPVSVATNAADIGSGVLPVGVTGGSGLTALGTVTVGNISHADIVYPAGHVLQVLSTTKGSTFSTNSADYVPITGLTVSITMSNASNKVLVFLSIGRLSPDTGAGATSAVQIVRGTTPIGGGTPAGGTAQVSVAFATNAGSTNTNYVGVGGLGAQFLDTPGTGTHVYGAYTVGADGGANWTHVNRNLAGGTAGASYESAASSAITVMEVVV